MAGTATTPGSLAVAEAAPVAAARSGSRLGIITVDQAISGASNVLIAVLAARALGVTAFGLFGIVFLVYMLALGVSRALVCDPLLIHPVESRERTGEIVGTAASVGIGVGVVVTAAGLVVTLASSRLGLALVALGVLFPFLVMQDFGRYLGFVTERPSRAVILDVVWLVLQIVAIVGLFAFDVRNLFSFVAAWAGAGALSGLLLIRWIRGVRVQVGLAWLRHTWQYSWRYLISYSANQGAALVGSSAIGAIAGSRALAGIQGSTLLARPFSTFQVAAIAAGTADIARSVETTAHMRVRALRITLFTGVAALLTAVVLVILPDRLGRLVLGASWAVTHPLVPATAAQLVVLGIITGARCGLLGTRAIRKAMLIDVATTVLVLGGAVVGSVLDGALGAIWAITLVQALVAIVWWVTLLAHRADPAAVPVVATVAPAT